MGPPAFSAPGSVVQAVFGAGGSPACAEDDEVGMTRLDAGDDLGYGVDAAGSTRLTISARVTTPRRRSALMTSASWYAGFTHAGQLFAFH